MKVILTSNLLIRGIFEPPLAWYFEGEAILLRALLQRAQDMLGSLRIMEQGEAGDDVRDILINGEHYFAKGRSGAVLKDGDRVELHIYMDPLGGG